MYNWNTDTTQLKKNPEKYSIWRLEQLINFGLDGEKIDKKELEIFWSRIQDKLDPYKKTSIRIFTMGKTILTPKQSHFLELAQSESQITKRFYLTGGTALSEFYLHHRLSHDIDLFTEQEEVNQRVTEAFLKKISSQLKVVRIKRSQFLGLFSYGLVYEDGEELKVDFNYYPFPRIQKGTKYKNLEVDSVYDIAVNKLHTIFTKPRSRDYLDLYLIMKQHNYSLDRLILDAKAKFDWDIDRITLASQFIKVTDMDESSMMLEPFDKKEMDKFFLQLASSLKGEIFK